MAKRDKPPPPSIAALDGLSDFAKAIGDDLRHDRITYEHAREMLPPEDWAVLETAYLLAQNELHQHQMNLLRWMWNNRHRRPLKPDTLTYLKELFGNDQDTSGPSL